MKKRRQRKPLEQVHVRDRFEVALTPQLEAAIRKAGTHEPVVTTKAGTPLFGVCIGISAVERWGVLSSVAPLDDKETCPMCGSRDFEQTAIGHMPWVPDPNKRTCRCGARWKLCGNDLPLLEPSGA